MADFQHHFLWLTQPKSLAYQSGLHHRLLVISLCHEELGNESGGRPKNSGKESMTQEVTMKDSRWLGPENGKLRDKLTLAHPSTPQHTPAQPWHTLAHPSTASVLAAHSTARGAPEYRVMGIPKGQSHPIERRQPFCLPGDQEGNSSKLKRCRLEVIQQFHEKEQKQMTNCSWGKNCTDFL